MCIKCWVLELEFARCCGHPTDVWGCEISQVRPLNEKKKTSLKWFDRTFLQRHIWWRLSLEMEESVRVVKGRERGKGGRRGTERNTCERNTSCCLSKCGYQTLNAHGQTVFKKYKKKKMLLYFISMNKCHWDLTFSCSLHSCCSVAAHPTSAGREDARCRMSQFLPWFSEILWGIIHY